MNRKQLTFMELKGGAQVFDRYIEQYGQKLFGLCMHLCRERWDAQDLYQETWLKVYQARHGYDSSRDFGVWISKICVNLYRDKLRRKKLLSFLPFVHQEQEAQLAAPEQEDYSDLYQAVRQLPDAYRMVVVLYYFLGCQVNADCGSIADCRGYSQIKIKQGAKLTGKESA